MRATISERGNGFPNVGDYVAGDDGNLYEVTALNTRICTAASGDACYLHAEVELADWDDVDSDDDVFPADVEVL